MLPRISKTFADFSIKVSLNMGGIDRPIMRKTRGT